MTNKKDFHWSNLDNQIVGANIAEGDIILSVRFGSDRYTPFYGEWEVKKVNGQLGIIWGYKKEFIPFKNFATRVIFTKK